MKKIALYIILFSYTVIMIKPVSPYIADTVAHIFFYAQHMATVHYQNGKFHVHREVIDNAKKTANQTESPASKKDNSTSDHIALQQKTDSVTAQTQIFYFQQRASALPNSYLEGIYQPPRIGHFIFVSRFNA